MILEVYNTEDYATKVSEYANDYQNAEEYAKRDMLEVHTSDLKFNYYKLLLTITIVCKQVKCIRRLWYM